MTAVALDAIQAPTARLILPPRPPDALWHAVRAGGIGGSDVAAVLGMDRWKSPLRVWREKLGLHSDPDSEAAECGRELEDDIARLFARRTGFEIAPSPGTLAHVDHPWMRVNIDRLVLEPAEAGGTVVVPLECKNRSEYMASDWDAGVPDEPALQGLWAMAVGGWPHAWVAALIGGNRLRWHRLERDQELIDHLIDFCGRWWQRHVIDGEPPVPDGSRATADFLDHLWESQENAIVQVDPVRAGRLITRRAALKDRIAVLDRELTEIENQMKADLGDAEIATDANGRTLYTWRANGTFRSVDFREQEPELAALYTRPDGSLDLERLAAEHPDTYRRYRARVLRVPAKGPQP